MGFSGIYDCYLASSTGFAGDPNTDGAATEVEGAQQLPDRASAVREE